MPAITAPAQVSPVIAPGKKKIVYIDHLRILLTVLVILHHTFVTYGAPGSWYYNEKSTALAALIPMTLFVATNQSFFMGFFFFLSALFTEKSYRAKGPGPFLADRIRRLGIPLLFYSFILSPILNYMVARFGRNEDISFLQYLKGYDNWIHFGVLWFVVALLMFTLVHVAIQRLFPQQEHTARKVPSYRSIIGFAIVLGVTSFLVRLLFPIGWTLKPVGFQLAHFPQYIVMFYFGIVAARNNWLEKFSFRRTGILPFLLVLVVFPLIYLLAIITKSPGTAFNGGFTWQSFTIAVWEQVTGFSIIAALLTVARRKWNQSSLLSNAMSRSAFAAYIIHPFFVTAVSLSLKGQAMGVAAKLAIVGPVAIVLTFLTAMLLVRLPVVKDIV